MAFQYSSSGRRETAAKLTPPPAAAVALYRAAKAEVSMRFPCLFFLSLDVYASIWSQEVLRRQTRLGHLEDCLFHACPVGLPQLFSQPALCGGPKWLRRRQLPPAGPGETKQTLPPVLSAARMYPALFEHEPQGPRQRGGVHDKTRTQALLIRFAGKVQRGEQAELGDLDPGLRQFLV